MPPPDDHIAPPSSMIKIRDSRIYLDADIYERYFRGVESVILLRRDNNLLILPVRHAAAGGYLLKIRNSAGDRVVNATDFLEYHGLKSETEISSPVFWSRENAALIADDIFNIANQVFNMKKA